MARSIWNPSAWSSSTRVERLRMGFPHGYRKTTTLVAGLRMTGMVAPMVLGGPINGDWLEAYVIQVLVPELRPGDVIIMGNLSSHKRASVRDSVEAADATLRLLPSCGLDFNLIGKAFSRPKAMLRKIGERTVSGLWGLVSRLVDIFQPHECANYFTSSGYDPMFEKRSKPFLSGVRDSGSAGAVRFTSTQTRTTKCWEQTLGACLRSRRGVTICASPTSKLLPCW